MRYFLLGLPGSGKSHWGKIWSEKLKLHHYDLDEIIENNEGESITDIFKNEGEEHFRNLETFYLHKLINNYNSLVISTGGGTPCFNENLKLMNSQGTSIFLNPSIEEIANRIWNPTGENKRPMFSDCNSIEDVQKVLNELQQKRIQCYRNANYELDRWGLDTILKLK
jgi:shikimate kinase